MFTKNELKDMIAEERQHLLHEALPVAVSWLIRYVVIEKGKQITSDAAKETITDVITGAKEPASFFKEFKENVIGEAEREASEVIKSLLNVEIEIDLPGGEKIDLSLNSLSKIFNFFKQMFDKPGGTFLGAVGNLIQRDSGISLFNSLAKVKNTLASAKVEKKKAATTLSLDNLKLFILKGSQVYSTVQNLIDAYTEEIVEEAKDDASYKIDDVQRTNQILLAIVSGMKSAYKQVQDNIGPGDYKIEDTPEAQNIAKYFLDDKKQPISKANEIKQKILDSIKQSGIELSPENTKLANNSNHPYFLAMFFKKVLQIQIGFLKSIKTGKAKIEKPITATSTVPSPLPDLDIDDVFAQIQAVLS